MDVIVKVILVGLVATLAIDIWATFANKILGLPRTNWAMVGRWLGHIPRGKLAHDPIASSAAIAHEILIGWLFHYLIGITYAAAYIGYVFGALDKLQTLRSGLAFGALTTLSPWFLMQPALGLGVCAMKAPQPNLVRLQNIIIHLLFGATLYVGCIALEVFR